MLTLAKETSLGRRQRGFPSLQSVDGKRLFSRSRQWTDGVVEVPEVPMRFS